MYKNIEYNQLNHNLKEPMRLNKTLTSIGEFQLENLENLGTQ